MQREKQFFFSVNILGNSLAPTKPVRNLSVWFDSDFPYSRHVQNICNFCLTQIQDLKCLRGYLTSHAALMAVNALVGNRLDYCNSMIRSLSGLESLPTPLSIHTSLLLESLSIGELCSIFKTALLV